MTQNQPTRRYFFKKKNFFKMGLEMTRGQKIFAVAFVVIMTLSLYFICFFERDDVYIEQQTIANQRIISAIKFQYKSQIHTDMAKDREAAKVFPCYEVEKFSRQTLEHNIKLLDEELNKYEQPAKKMPLNVQEKEAAKSLVKDDLEVPNDETLVKNLKSLTGLNVNKFDLPIIRSIKPPESRLRTFNLALTALEGIINDGVYEDGDSAFANAENKNNVKYRSQSEAKIVFKRKIYSLGFEKGVSDMLLRIFNQEILPNVRYNEAETQKRQDEARASVKPITVTIYEGEVINDPSRKITPLDLERLNAYNSETKKSMPKANIISQTVIGLAICLMLTLAATFFIAVSKSSTSRRIESIVLFCILIIISMGIERAILELADIRGIRMVENLWMLTACWTPLLIGITIQVLLCSSYTACTMAFLLSTLTAIMFGNRIDFFVLIFTASVFSIFVCNNVKSRKHVILSGFSYGAFLAVFWFIFAISSCEYSATIILKQSFAVIFFSILASIIATSILPVFERVFKMSSNLSLLELTKYDNPVLQKLQMEAPGTYSHSVATAQLAEQAAIKVRANPLLCTVISLYHDIGKVIKPEYFSENQQGINQHDAQTPQMSAQIIKSHVRDGVTFAKSHKLPMVIRNAIRQHHGTSIIFYFYEKAKILAGIDNKKVENLHVLRQALHNSGIEEADYRHEGEKPKTVENAILMLADSCEAASRSLRHVTLHSIEELVEKIFNEKINDGQLDEAPITVKQIAAVKESFVETLRHMLHARIGYDEVKNTKVAAPAKETAKTSNDAQKNNE